MLAQLADLNGIMEKMRPASISTMDIRPEMLAALSFDDYSVQSTEDWCQNYVISIAMHHFVVMSLHMTMRLTSTRKTNNQYRVGAGMTPFFNTILRDNGLCCHYASDFLFEALMKDPRRFFRDHGGYITQRTMGWAIRNKIQKLFRRAQGWLPTFNTMHWIQN
eukprot:COSAG02_NODE_1878_length_10554_cov_95.091918_3_plen_163_part_00